MKSITNVILYTFTFAMFLVELSFSQIQNTWELLKRHEIYYSVKNQKDTLITDTVIIEQPQSTFYKYTKDSLYEYDLDYEDSKERNCYMYWVFPYKLLNDSVFDIGISKHPEVKITSTFKITGDTLLYSELWWEDWPDYIYQQSKYFYFIKKVGFSLPPQWWPETECHSTNTIIKTQNRRLIYPQKDIQCKYNLLGEIVKPSSTGIIVNKNVKKLNFQKK